MKPLTEIIQAKGFDSSSSLRQNSVCNGPMRSDVSDHLGFVRDGALRHTGQPAQLVSRQMRSLGPVEQEVHAAHRVDRRRSPNAKVAARERRWALASQLDDQLPDQFDVFGVEMLGTEWVGELEDLLNVVPERIGDAKWTVVAHAGRIVH